MKLGVLFSSGKDSSYAAYLASKEHELVCLITIKSKNKDSYMFHTPNIDLVKFQAKAIGLPLILEETKGEKEKELVDLERAIKRAMDEFKIEGVVTGALFSEYQKSRIEKICSKLGLKVINPLWHKDQEEEMRELVRVGFEVILTAIASDGLDKSWLGRKIDNKMVDELVELNRKNGINISFEGGEAESLTLWCPLFKKKLEIVDSEIIEESENIARLDIKKVRLV